MIHFNEETRNKAEVESLIGKRIEKVVNHKTAIEYELLKSNSNMSSEDKRTLDTLVNRMLEMGEK